MVDWNATRDSTSDEALGSGHLAAMGISRDNRHKRRLTGGRRNPHQKKRKFELGRQAALTKLGPKTVHVVRVRGGSSKFRALKLEGGNFSWGTQNFTHKTKILDVVYNASNNELVRTKTLVKNCIVQVDATPFRDWYQQHYGVAFSKTKKANPVEPGDMKGKSDHVQRKLKARNEDRALEARLAEQFNAGRLLACISSRPGQIGRCDGYILEGKELEFYLRKLQKKKGKKQ
jgi:small subunit ribosomal protein S8e